MAVGPKAFCHRCMKQGHTLDECAAFQSDVFYSGNIPNRRGVEQRSARRAHNPEVAGSNPAPATTDTKGLALPGRDGVGAAAFDPQTAAMERRIQPTATAPAVPPRRSGRPQVVRETPAETRTGRRGAVGVVAHGSKEGGTEPSPRKTVTKNAVTKTRGRPKKIVTLSNADRQRAYRERKSATV